MRPSGACTRGHEAGPRGDSRTQQDSLGRSPAHKGPGAGRGAELPQTTMKSQSSTKDCPVKIREKQAGTTCPTQDGGCPLPGEQQSTRSHSAAGAIRSRFKEQQREIDERLGHLPFLPAQGNKNRAPPTRLSNHEPQNFGASSPLIWSPVLHPTHITMAPSCICPRFFPHFLCLGKATILQCCL